MSRVLYHERKERPDNKTVNVSSGEYGLMQISARITDYVEVEVRSWTCAGMTPDVVIESRSMVQRRLILDDRQVFAHNEADSYFIRMGIARFDELLARHPNLTPDAEEA